MERVKKILKKVFFLPLLPTVLLSVPAYALVIFVLSTGIEGQLAYLSYLASAYALIISLTALPRLREPLAALREKVANHPLMGRILEHPLGRRFLRDVRFRTEISLWQGLLVNLLYIAIKLVSGLYYRSFWFVSLAVYYALLAAMRVLLLHRGRSRPDRTPMETEIRRYRLCGVTLLVMNQALAGIVILMVRRNRGFDYPGVLIYAMAVYSFYSVILAVVNLVKFRKRGSPLLSAAKAINLVAAMVSVLSLETAMMARFGREDDPLFRKAMTGATGGGVCVIVIAMAVFMIWKSGKQLRELQGSGPEADG